MLASHRNCMKQWNHLEFLGISKPLTMLLYFYNNQFQHNETLEILSRVDNFNESNPKKSIYRLIFILADQAYNVRHKKGLFKTLHEMRHNPKFDLQIMITAWDHIQKQHSIKKIEFTFDELEEALRPSELFKIYGFSDLNPSQFDYVARTQSTNKWFESNFFYFYNSIHISNISLLLKDLNCANPGFPFSLFKVYLLAMIFSNRGKLQITEMAKELHNGKVCNYFFVFHLPFFLGRSIYKCVYSAFPCQEIQGFFFFLISICVFFRMI